MLTPVNTLTRSIYILKRKKFFLLLKKINSRVEIFVQLRSASEAALPDRLEN